MNATQSAVHVHAAKPSTARPIYLNILLAILVFASIYIAALRPTPNDSMFNIDYGFGPVIQGVVQQHRLGSINHNYGWWTYKHRLPLIPLLAAASYRLSPKASV